MLNEKKIRAIELLIENELTDVQIASTVGISPRQFGRWKIEGEFVMEWQRRATYLKNSIAKDIERKLSKQTDLAITTLIDLMKTCENSETKRKIAESILDRTGGKVSNNSELTINDSIDSSSDIKRYFDSIRTNGVSDVGE